jgi:two-component system, NtrC family, C4-dicarboxylate transport response regulator DctD
MAIDYVLVVEDEPLVRRALLSSLRHFDYEAVAVENAILALEAIARRMPSVVLTDVMMPVHDGVWLLEHVRERWPNLPIVMMSGALLPEATIHQARRLGAVDFLGKPFTRAGLHQTIERATSQEATARV